MFKCKICDEKDKRITDLKEEILHIRAILNPPPRINRYEIEQDNLLNGGNSETIHPIDEESERLQSQAAQREADIIFSGNVIETGS